MLTFQDFEKSSDKISFISSAIAEYQLSEFYKTAITADLYDHQRNKTINEYVKKIFSLSGVPIEDYTASNNKISSNFFRRLNTQRCTYSLGNGISFQDSAVKDKLGISFDTKLKEAGYNALIHGVCYGFWNVNKLYVFPATEFVPLWDEYDGTLKAGIRFWRLDIKKPLLAVLYEVDGYTKYTENENGALVKVEEKKPYIVKVAYTEETKENEAVIGVENYSSLPIVPLWGSRLKQSTLVGMQQSIDSYDLIRSGFANDLTDCSEIYWLIENCGGMSEKDLAKFRDRMKLNHIVEVAGDEGARATPYTQEIPYQARKEYIASIRKGIYEDFGGLDVHELSADSTNDHIDAAYQPLDENADDFEYQIIEFVQQILLLQGIEDTPIFKRNRLSNQKEQVEMVLMAAEYLDDETIVAKLPFITVDELNEIIARKKVEELENSYYENEEEEEKESEVEEDV